MIRSLLAFVFVGGAVIAVAGCGATPPRLLDDAGVPINVGGSGGESGSAGNGSGTGGTSGTTGNGGFGTGGTGDPGTAGNGGGDVADASAPEDAGRRRRGDGGFMRGDGGGFTGGGDGGRRMRGDGGGSTRPDGGRFGGGGGGDAGAMMECPADAMNGAMCSTMEACTLPASSGMTGVCYCRMPRTGGAMTWRCVMR